MMRLLICILARAVALPDGSKPPPLPPNFTQVLVRCLKANDKTEEGDGGGGLLLSLSLYLSIFLSIYLSIYLSLHLYMHPFILLSRFLFRESLSWHVP